MNRVCHSDNKRSPQARLTLYQGKRVHVVYMYVHTYVACTWRYHIRIQTAPVSGDMKWVDQSHLSSNTYGCMNVSSFLSCPAPKTIMSALFVLKFNITYILPTHFASLGVIWSSLNVTVLWLMLATFFCISLAAPSVWTTLSGCLSSILIRWIKAAD